MQIFGIQPYNPIGECLITVGCIIEELGYDVIYTEKFHDMDSLWILTIIPVSAVAELTALSCRKFFLYVLSHNHSLYIKYQAIKWFCIALSIFPDIMLLSW